MPEPSKADLLLKSEFESKQEYKPQNPDEVSFNEELEASFQLAKRQFNRPYDFFQRRSLTDWLTINEQDSYALSYKTRKDVWRNNTRTMTQREKLEAVQAVVADANLQGEIRSFSMYGEELSDTAGGLEVLMEHARVLNDHEEKDRMAVFSLLRDGTRCEDVFWKVESRPIRSVSKVDWTKGIFSFSEQPNDKKDERIWTQGRPLNRVYLTDVRNPYIESQAAWKVTPMSYDQAKMRFGGWENWKYVRPSNASQFLEHDTPGQTEQQWNANMRDVVIRVFEDPVRDIYAVKINDVLMTPVNCPMPSRFTKKMHSFVWAVGFPFDEHFAYGDSFIRRMHNDAVMLDFVYNALIDRSRQEIEPPVVTSFRTILNKYMYAPGKSTPVGTEFKVERLIPDGANVINQGIATAEFIRDNMDRNSVAPIIQGQGGQNAQTKYEVQQQERAAWRTIWNVLFSVAMLKKRREEAMLNLILEHYPSMNAGSTMKNKVSDAIGGISRVFTANRPMGEQGEMGQARLAFANFSGNKNNLRSVQEAMRADEMSKSRGRTPHRWILLDPDLARKHEHVVYLSMAPSDRKSKKVDEAKERDEYLIRRGDPAINQWRNSKELLMSQKKDPEDGWQAEVPIAAPQGGGGQPMPPPISDNSLMPNVQSLAETSQME